MPSFYVREMLPSQLSGYKSLPYQSVTLITGSSSRSVVMAPDMSRNSSQNAGLASHLPEMKITKRVPCVRDCGSITNPRNVSENGGTDLGADHGERISE
jgi:hypothetical protein